MDRTLTCPVKQKEYLKTASLCYHLLLLMMLTLTVACNPTAKKESSSASGLSVSNSQITAPKSFVLINQSIVLTLQVNNNKNVSYNSPKPLSISFSVSGGTSDGVFSNTVSLGNGRYQTTFTGTVSGSAVKILASINGEILSTNTPSISVTDSVPASITVVSGSNQTAMIASNLPSNLVAIVKDINGNPLPGIIVNWSIASGSGGEVVSYTTRLTDDYGKAYNNVILGTLAGASATIRASVTGLATPADFYATSTPGALNKFDISSYPTTTAAGASFDITVTAKDRYDNIKTDYQGRIEFSSSDTSSPILPSAYTFTPGVFGNNGTATFNLGAALKKSGNQTITVKEVSSSVYTTTNNIAVTGGLPSSITILSGNNQSKTAGTALTLPFTVVVKDAYNNLTANQTVTWAVTSGAGVLSHGSSLTNASGQATSTLTLGNTAGANTVTATVSGVPAITFNATGVAGAPASIAKESGDAQTGIINSTALSPFIVLVKDANNNPVKNATVTWTITSGGGSLSTASVLTGADGKAQNILTLSGPPGSHTVTAVTGGFTASFSATSTVGSPYSISVYAGNPQTNIVAGTMANQMTAIVKDQYNNNLNGIHVTWSMTGGGGSFTMGTDTGTTDTNGRVTNNTFTTGASVGVNTVTASVVGIATPATFSITTKPDSPASVAIDSGNGQTGVVGKSLSMNFGAIVKDANNNIITGANVLWAVTAGGGSLNQSSSLTGVTGVAYSRLTLGSSGLNTVTATVGALPPAIFSATAYPVPTISSITRVTSSPTNATNVSFNVTFNTPVTGVTTGAFTLSTTGGISPSINGLSGSNSTYTVTVNTGSGDGTIKLNLSNVTGIKNAINTAMISPFSTGETYTIDKTLPNTSITTSEGSMSSALAIPFSVTFSKAMTGFTTGDITVSSGTIANFSGSGTTYTFDLTSMSEGPVSVNIGAGVAQDALGNLNTASAVYSLTYDITAPTPVTSVDDGNNYNSITSSPAITWSNDATDALSGFSHYEYSIGTSAGDTNVKTWTSTGTSSSVTATGLSLNNGDTYYVNVRAVDNAQNSSTITSSNGWTVDTVAPVVTITNPTALSQQSGTFIVTGTCVTADSNRVDLSFESAVVDGDSYVGCLGNAFSAEFVTNQKIASINLTVSQTDDAGNVGSASLQVLGLTEFTDMPKNQPTYTGLASNAIRDIKVTNSGNDVYLATDGGLSISYDGGTTFTNRTTSNGIPAKAINSVAVFGSGSTAKIYAATKNGLAISSDGGNTFTAKTTLNGSLAANDVRDVAYTTQSGTTQVFAATSAGLSISNNGGISFYTKKVIDGLPSIDLKSVYAVGVGTEAKIFVASDKGLSVSNDGGVSFTTPLTAATSITDVYVVGSGSSAWVFVTDYVKGLYISKDAGVTFTQRNVAVNNLASNQALRVYVTGTGASSKVYVGTTNGLSVSTDGGDSFVSKLTTAIDDSNDVNAIYTLESAGVATIFLGACNLATTTANDPLCKFYKSTDSGTSYSLLSVTNGIASNATSSVYVTGSGASSNVFVGTLGYGLAVSTDNGKTFTHRLKGAAANTLNSNFVTDVVASGTGGSALLYVATNDGVAISSNGGSTFTRRLVGTPINAIFFSPPTTIYAATSVGLQVSTDNGASFALKTGVHGLPSLSVKDVFLVGTKTFVATDAGLGVSDDGTSQVFTTKSHGLPSLNVKGVHVIMNGSQEEIYVATDGGFAVSYDGGDNFYSSTNVNSTGIFAIDAGGNIEVYLNTPNGLMISYNGGSTFDTSADFKKIANGLGSNNITSTFVQGTGASQYIYVTTDAGASIKKP